MTEMEPADFHTAAVFIETPIALRARDALHLAVAHSLGARIASLDRRLCDASETPGLAGFDLS